MKIDLKLQDCEVKKFTQGNMYLGPSDGEQSVGFLELLPNQGLKKHNRPVDEKLKQIKGSCVMKLFQDGKLIEKVELKEGNELVIPANQYHQHTNFNNGKSLTYWQFDGDIVEIIRNIQKKGLQND